jgi:hypothetical protein
MINELMNSMIFFILILNIAKHMIELLLILLTIISIIILIIVFEEFVLKL